MLDKICGFDYDELMLYDVDSKNFDKLKYSDIVRNNKHVAFSFLNLIDEEQNYVIDMLSKIIYILGDTVFYIDEAHKFFPQYNYPIELERVIRGGRKRGVDSVLVSQQVIDLQKSALKQANIGIFFRITEENELKKLRAMGISPQIVSSLPLYKCYVYDFITGEGGITSAEEIAF